MSRARSEPSEATVRGASGPADEGSGGEGALPEGVLAVRVGPGANCSSAGSAIDVLFYGSVIAGAIAVALAAAFPPREARDDEDEGPIAPDPPGSEA